MTFDYEGWLKTAQDRLETLYEQKASIESEITLLEEGIKGFAPLINQPRRQSPDVGITEAVTNLLESEPSRLYAATEVRHELLERGISLNQRNPLATIYQVLARLVEKGAVIVTTHDAGRNRYKWVEGWELKKRQERRKTKD